MTDYYLNNPDHPLNGLFKIEDKNWTTPIAEINFPLSFKTRLNLIHTIAKKSFHKGIKNFNATPRTPDNPDTKYASKHFYNLLTSRDSDPSINDFAEHANELIRYYIANAWGVPDIEETQIEAKCFGNMQVHGQRTYPHYHHGFDGVLITYLTCGGEFDLDLESEDLIVECEKNVKVEHDKYDHLKNDRAIWGKMGNSTHPGDFEEEQNMLILDPRPAITYPYNNKAKAYTPKTGNTVIHPGYLWHESNTFMGTGIRVAIILNFKVGLGKSPEPLTIL